MLKSDAAFGCCGSGILLNRLLESSLIFKGFSRLPTRFFALLLAVSMGRIIERLITLARGRMQ
ncbi:hypothetical protein RY45_04255 [Aeromonas hydrophila]|nr:hypothetical protein RY45_04255 [Aeromonas hydrophila]